MQNNSQKQNDIRILVICGIYCILSLFLFFVMSGGKGLIAPDTKSYTDPAVNIIRMGFFSADGVHPDYYRTPGYPLFIALVYALGGSNSVIVLLQIVLYAITIYLFYATLQLLQTPRNTALIGASLLLFNLTAYLSVYILTETLFYFCLSLSLYLLVKYLSGKNIWFFCGFALALNYALLVRPVLIYFNLLFNLFLLILVVRKKLLFRCFVIFLAVFAGLCGGWSYRNYTHSSVFAFTSVQNSNYFGYYAPKLTASITGMSMEEAQAWHSEKFAREYPNSADPELNVMQMSLLKKKYAVNYMKNNFPQFIVLNITGLYKLLFTFSTGWSQRSYLPNMPKPLTLLVYGLSWLYLALIYVFYFAGLICNRKQINIPQVFVFILSAYLILASAFWGAARYRDPFLPLLLLSAVANSKAIIMLCCDKIHNSLIRRIVSFLLE